jgi:uroporphyrinogen-III synthase
VTRRLARTDAGTLAGRTIVVTRPRAQSGDLVRALEARGARALVAPAIRLVPAPAKALDPAVDAAAAGRFAWVVFTSAAGVEAVFDRLRSGRARRRSLRAKVAAVGEGTAASLRARGVRPDLVPATFTTEALGRAMPRGRGEVLLARADVAPEGLERALSAKGWSPVRVDAYRTRDVRTLPRTVQRALLRGEVDAVTFTSASTVRGFVRAAGPMLRHPVVQRRHVPAVVCIGPVTSREARLAGLQVRAVGRPHTIEGLVAALERTLGAGANAKE